MSTAEVSPATNAAAVEQKEENKVVNVSASQWAPLMQLCCHACPSAHHTSFSYTLCCVYAQPVIESADELLHHPQFQHELTTTKLIQAEITNTAKSGPQLQSFAHSTFGNILALQQQENEYNIGLTSQGYVVVWDTEESTLQDFEQLYDCTLLCACFVTHHQRTFTFFACKSSNQNSKCDALALTCCYCAIWMTCSHSCHLLALGLAQRDHFYRLRSPLLISDGRWHRRSGDIHIKCRHHRRSEPSCTTLTVRSETKEEHVHFYRRIPSIALCAPCMCRMDHDRGRCRCVRME